MPHTVTSNFSQADDFQNAMAAEGSIGLVVTRPGRFQARLTQVSLGSLRLTDVEETVARIAFISVPQNTIMIALSLGHGPGQVWGGIGAEREDLVMLGSGQSAHVRTEGPCHWGTIWLPSREFVQSTDVFIGHSSQIASGPCVWRPATSVRRELRRLYSFAVQAMCGRPGPLTDAEAAHGLEQQLIHASIECVSGRLANGCTAMRRRQRELMVQFEDFFATEPPSEMSIPAITSALGVSDRFLRSSCKEQLGMSPLSYLRFRRLQSARRDLRHAAPDTLTVTEAGRRYGFHDRGRFAAAYRRLFGEQPSVTLHMGPNQPMPELTLRRRPRRTPRPASQLS